MADSTITSLSTIATDPLRNFRFHATFSAADDALFDNRITRVKGGFQSISGLDINVSSIPYREGGYNTTMHQIPGMASFSPITMSRGVIFNNPQAMVWMRGLFAVTAGEGLNLGNGTAGNRRSFRCNIKIYVNEHPNAEATKNLPRMGFYVRNAWPSAINYSGLNATGNGLMMETVTFVHEGLSVFYTDLNGDPFDSTFKISG